MQKILYNLFIKNTDVAWIQFLRYIFVGGVSALINISTLFILTDFCHIFYLISNIVGFILGLTTNYLLSKKFIFTTKITLSKSFEFFTYCAVGLIGLGLDTTIMWIATSKMGIYYIITKLISTACVFIWNFIGRKSIYIIFKHKENI